MKQAGSAARQGDWEAGRDGAVVGSIGLGAGPREPEGMLEEMERLRQENRRLAVSLGAFSAFIASRGLLEEAWHFIHNVHQLEDAGPD